MVGRDVEFLRKPLTGDAGRGRAEGAGRLPCAAVSTTHTPTVLRDMSVEVRAGEIIGFAGLVGAGRTELARVIFGADPCDQGIIYVNGRQISPLRSPKAGIDAGIALVPEDRKQQACFLIHSIRQNMSLPSLGRLSSGGTSSTIGAETKLIEEYRKKLQVKMANDQVAIGTLSGGNQQKVILARCMALKPKVLIVDEPTRGIDVGAKAEVHQVLFDMARSGIAVIVISSELPEVMAISDRIVTFREGQITGVMPAAEATEEKLMSTDGVGCRRASRACRGGVRRQSDKRYKREVRKMAKAISGRRNQPDEEGFDFVGFMEKYGVLVFLVLLILIFTAYNPRFLSARNITNILTEVSIYGIIGVGMTYVILTGGIDLAVGSLLAFAAMCGAYVVQALGGDFVMSWFVALLDCLLSARRSATSMAKWLRSSMCRRSS